MAKKTGWVYVPINKNKPGVPGHWNEKKRLEAVTTFIATGNLALTGRLCNIPDDTIRKWKAQQWWQELTDRFYEEEDMELSSKLKNTLQKSIDVVNDRIQHGDFQYDQKTGKLVRVPVKLRDAHKVTADLIDKRTVLRKNQRHAEVSSDTIDSKLVKLASAFAEFVSQKPAETIDAEFVEVVGE